MMDVLLQDSERAYSLHAGRVLGHSERVEDGSRSVLGHGFGDLLDLSRWDAGDALADGKRVPRDEHL